MPVIDIDGPANLAVVTTAETVIATLSGVNTRPGGSPVILQGNCTLTTGVGTTSVVLTVRRGTTTAGAQVGASQPSNIAAGATGLFEIQVDDNPGEIANASYVLTVRQIAATGNGTSVSANLRAEF